MNKEDNCLKGHTPGGTWIVIRTPCHRWLGLKHHYKYVLWRISIPNSLGSDMSQDMGFSQPYMNDPRAGSNSLSTLIIYRPSRFVIVSARSVKGDSHPFENQNDAADKVVGRKNPGVSAFGGTAFLLASMRTTSSILGLLSEHSCTHRSPTRIHLMMSYKRWPGSVNLPSRRL